MKSSLSFVLKTTLITLACHPVMLIILSPYMLWIGLTWDQLVLWWWSGLFIGIFLNLVLTIYIKWIAPKIGKLVDEKVL